MKLAILTLFNLMIPIKLVFDQKCVKGMRTVMFNVNKKMFENSFCWLIRTLRFTLLCTWPVTPRLFIRLAGASVTGTVGEFTIYLLMIFISIVLKD